MITSLYIAGFIGILFHVFAIKLPALKERAEKANLTFVPAEYFKKDWIALGASVIVVIAVIFVFPEIVKKYPSLNDFAKIFMISIGFNGSSLAQSWLGKTGKWINSVVDVKTNIADNKNDL